MLEIYRYYYKKDILLSNFIYIGVVRVKEMGLRDGDTPGVLLGVVDVGVVDVGVVDVGVCDR